jgi:ribosomal protein S17E
MNQGAICMSTMTSTAIPAKKSYYRLLEASFDRAKRLLDEMNSHPEKYTPERKRETIAYLTHLQNEMRRLKIDP